MELTPQALHDVEFREARRNGYNTRDVDDFLERVAAGVGQLQDRLRDAYHRAEAAEARLADIQRQLDDVQRRPAPPADPAVTASDADETLRRTLVLAQRTADATIKDAQDEASRLLDEARDQAQQARSSAEAEAARVRASAESEALRDARAEVDELTTAREALLQDIEVLEQHVDEQRNQIRDGLSELQRVVDDPATFRMEPAPKVTDLGVPSAPPSRSHFGQDLPGNGNLSATNGSAGIHPPVEPPMPPAPPVEEHSDNGTPVNDGSVVAALQELHRGGPGQDEDDTLPHDVLPHEPPPHEPLPSREPLPGREPLPQRDALPPREPLPSREPLPGREPLPSREPLPQRDGFPQREPLPQRDAPPPPHEPLPSREPLPGREPLPQRDGFPQREPLPQRDEVPQRASFPAASPAPAGSTGFLPDLRAAFEPPPDAGGGPVDDRGLAPLDAPPPPPPPPGFEHLQQQQDVGGIPIEPGSRPSEWGRGVFDTDEEGDPAPGSPFGRHR